MAGESRTSSPAGVTMCLWWLASVMGWWRRLASGRGGGGRWRNVRRWHRSQTGRSRRRLWLDGRRTGRRSRSSWWPETGKICEERKDEGDGVGSLLLFLYFFCSLLVFFFLRGFCSFLVPRCFGGSRGGSIIGASKCIIGPGWASLYLMVGSERARVAGTRVGPLRLLIFVPFFPSYVLFF